MDHHEEYVVLLEKEDNENEYYQVHTMWTNSSFSISVLCRDGSHYIGEVRF